MLTWFRKHTKTIMIAVVVIFAGSMFYGLGYRGLKGGGSGGGNSKAIAKINGREIDPIRFREILNRSYQSFGQNADLSMVAFIENMALGQAIDYTIILNEARKRVKVSGREVDAAVDNIMKQQKVPSKRELERALKQVGLSLGQFRDLVKDDITVQKFSMKLQQETKLLPEDLKEIRASHLLVSTEAEAKQLLAQIKGGADFAALAKKYSLDPGTANKGGDLGYFTIGAMVPEFEKVSFSLKPGEVSQPIKTAFGYHIIKVTDSRLRKIDEQKALQEKAQNAYRRLYSELRSKAKVEIISPIFKGHNYRFSGKLTEAISEYKKAVAQNPGNPLPHIYLGDSFLSIGQNNLAITEYENAVKLEGGNPDLYIVLGKAYEKAKQPALAAEQYRKASMVAGDNKAAHEKLLKVFEQMKKPTEVAREKSELNRLAKKAAFEKELTGGK
ncbi:MAG: peptidylprolyl isomerase [bacterium]